MIDPRTGADTPTTWDVRSQALLNRFLKPAFEIVEPIAVYAGISADPGYRSGSCIEVIVFSKDLLTSKAGNLIYGAEERWQRQYGDRGNRHIHMHSYPIGEQAPKEALADMRKIHLDRTMRYAQIWPPQQPSVPQ